MAGPKADRLELLRATHLNTSPIWLLAREYPPELEEAWERAESRPATVEFTWRQERHRLWVVDDADLVARLSMALDGGAPLYVADGHHRYETSLAFKTEAGASVAGAGAVLAGVTWGGDPGWLARRTPRLRSRPPD